jgi:tRNA nucleotidyltransferase (CCA-adding enzyme)
VQKLSGRRIYNELLLLFKEPNPVRIVERLHELGVLTAIHPQLTSIDEVRQMFGNIRAVIAWYQLLYRDESIKEAVLYFLALIDQLDAPAAKALCAHFMLKHKTVQMITLARNGYTLIERPLLDNPDAPTAADIYHVFHDLPLEAILYWMAKTKQDVVKKAASTYLAKLRDLTPTVTGKDLVRMGLPPGPIFQRILKEILDARLNGQISAPEHEYALAQEKIAAVLRSQG